MNYVRTVNFLISFMTNMMINEEKFKGSSHCFIIVDAQANYHYIADVNNQDGERERERDREKVDEKTRKMNEYMIWLQ